METVQGGAAAILMGAALTSWFIASWWMATQAARLISDGANRLELRLIVFLALAPLVLYDELLGRAQFKELCRERSAPILHASDVAGRQVRLSHPSPEAVGGLLLPVQAQRWIYIDATTREPLLSFVSLSAQGGKLSRALAGDAPSRPLTFSGVCASTGHRAIVAALQLRPPPGRPSAQGPDLADPSGLPPALQPQESPRP